MIDFTSEDIILIRKMHEEEKAPIDEIAAVFGCGYKPIRRAFEQNSIGRYGKKSYVIRQKGKPAIFTAEGDAIIKQMLLEEQTISAIREALNGIVGEKVISRRIQELGLEPTGRKIELTPEQIETVKRMHAEGAKERDIANAIGGSRALVKRVFNENNLKANINGKIRQDPEKHAKVLSMYAEGIGTVEIAKEFNVHRGAIQAILLEEGIDISRVLTDEEKKQALELREQGLGTRTIGTVLKRDRDTIRRYFDEIGLRNIPPPPKPPQPEPTTKTCNVCNEEKPIENFKKNWKTKQNGERVFSRHAKCDTCRNLRKTISSAILSGLKRANSSKGGGSCFDFLPYTLLELKNHIESLFEPWMTWNNWGQYTTETWDDADSASWTWHLDHIIPHASFKYTTMEEPAFLECWALSNLRPLSAKQNVLDNDRGIRLI